MMFLNNFESAKKNLIEDPTEYDGHESEVGFAAQLIFCAPSISEPKSISMPDSVESAKNLL